MELTDAVEFRLRELERRGGGGGGGGQVYKKNIQQNVSIILLLHRL